jgi:hypothetical protein
VIDLELNPTLIDLDIYINIVMKRKIYNGDRINPKLSNIGKYDLSIMV